MRNLFVAIPELPSPMFGSGGEGYSKLCKFISVLAHCFCLHYMYARVVLWLEILSPHRVCFVGFIVAVSGIVYSELNTGLKSLTVVVLCAKMCLAIECAEMSD